MPSGASGSPAQARPVGFAAHTATLGRKQRVRLPLLYGVLSTGHQRGPGPPAALRRRPEARIRLDSSRSSSSCEVALCS